MAPHEAALRKDGFDPLSRVAIGSYWVLRANLERYLRQRRTGIH
jgi:hypothetical protein